MKIEYLTEQQILLIHSLLIDEIGGRHGLRDLNILLSVEGQPKQTFGGEDLYPTLFHKAAVYARNIIFNHPFVDGNKRTGMTAASVFLEINRYQLVAKKGDVEKCAMKIIREKWDIEKIFKWFAKFSCKTKC